MQKIYSELTMILLSIGTLAHAQQKTLWQRDIPSSTQDFISGVNTTLDRQFLVFGSSIKPQGQLSSLASGTPNANTGYDFHIIKFSQAGSRIWEKFFGGGRQDYLNSSTATAEGGFLLAGTSFSGQGGDKRSGALGGSDAWLIKLSEDGEEEWQATIGTDRNDRAKAAVQSASGSFFVAGETERGISNQSSTDIFVTVLDDHGKTMHSIMLGGSGFDGLEKMVPTQDGGVLLAIYSLSGDFPTSDIYPAKTQPRGEGNNGKKSTATNGNPGQLQFERVYGKEGKNMGEGDYWIVKLSAEGKLQWQKNFGGSGDDHVRCLSATPDSFLVAGESRSPVSGNKSVSAEKGTDVWAVSLDNAGRENWQKSYSFGNRDVIMSLNAISENMGTNTKGYLLGGYTQAEDAVQKNDETFWMLYIDNDGKEQWRKYVEGESRKNEERLASANLNPDGTYILAGTSADEAGKENWKILKLGDRQIDQLIEKQDIRVYPNPVQDFCYVEIGEEFREAEIALYDFSGKMVQSMKTKNAVTKLNTAALPQGVYIVNAKTENKLLNAKIIKR